MVIQSKYVLRYIKNIWNYKIDLRIDKLRLKTQSFIDQDIQTHT